MNTEHIKSYLSFHIGEETFAAHVNYVRSIKEMVEITKIPDSPDYLLGVINLHGQVLPVIDARVKLNMTRKEDIKDSTIVVFEININKKQMLLGAVVDAVDEVFEAEGNQIKNPLDLGNYYRSDFIKGLVEKDNKFIIILDVNKIFSTKDLINLKESSEAYAENTTPEETEKENEKNAENDTPAEEASAEDTRIEDTPKNSNETHQAEETDNNKQTEEQVEAAKEDEEDEAEEAGDNDEIDLTGADDEADSQAETNRDENADKTENNTQS